MKWRGSPLRVWGHFGPYRAVVVRYMKGIEGENIGAFSFDIPLDVEVIAFEDHVELIPKRLRNSGDQGS